jgi:hypothetical protein
VFAASGPASYHPGCTLMRQVPMDQNGYTSRRERP